MSPPEGLKSLAEETVTDLFAGRLERGGISTTRPEFYFQCEAGESRAFAGGLEVRVKTWRHWSDATVELNAQTGEVMGRAVDRYCDPPNDREMPQAAALQVAAEDVGIPP